MNQKVPLSPFYHNQCIKGNCADMELVTSAVLGLHTIVRSDLSLSQRLHKKYLASLDRELLTSFVARETKESLCYTLKKSISLKLSRAVEFRLCKCHLCWAIPVTQNWAFSLQSAFWLNYVTVVSAAGFFNSHSLQSDNCLGPRRHTGLGG